MHSGPDFQLNLIKKYEDYMIFFEKNYNKSKIEK